MRRERAGTGRALDAFGPFPDDAGMISTSPSVGPYAPPPIVQYAPPDMGNQRVWNAVRLGLIIWASVVILRHAFYWIHIYAMTHSTPTLQLAQTLLDVVGLILVIVGATRGGARAILVVGLYVFLAAVLLGFGLSVMDLRSGAPQALTALPWRFFGSLTAGAPAILALLATWAARRVQTV